MKTTSPSKGCSATTCMAARWVSSAPAASARWWRAPIALASAARWWPTTATRWTISQAIGVTYVDRDELFERSDIISLHCPLTPETHYLIDEAIARAKHGFVLINTSRGALINAEAVIERPERVASAASPSTSTSRRPTCSSRTSQARSSRTTCSSAS